ncbi:MAG: TolC family protein [Planctomycetota bacterium]|nr:TolC family protein [Planctomycetota bacterium]
MNARLHTVTRAWLLSAVAIVFLVAGPARAEEPVDGTRSVVKLVRPVSARQQPGPSESANTTDAPSTIAIPVESDGPGRPRTLVDLEALALGNNPTLAQSRAQVSAAQGRYVQGGLYPNPSIGYMGSEIGNTGYGGQQGAYVGQRIITAKKLQLNRATIDQEIVQAEWAAQAQEQRVLNDVRTAYYELLVARRAVELQEQLLNIGQERRACSKCGWALLARRSAARWAAF